MKATDEEVAILTKLGFKRSEWAKRETWELQTRGLLPVSTTKLLAGWDGPFTLLETLAKWADAEERRATVLLEQATAHDKRAQLLRSAVESKCDTK